MHEKCGVVGVVDLDGRQDVVPLVAAMTEGVQHRGRKGAGMAWSPFEGGEIRIHKAHGLVEDVLGAPRLAEIGAAGPSAIAHTRYATNVLLNEEMLHPYGFPEDGFAFAFNGNIPDYAAQEYRLREAGHAPRLEGDTEIIGRTIAHALRMQQRRSIHRALQAVGEMDGAYNIVLLQRDGSMSAARDRHGFHPLVWAEKGSLVAVASEDSAIKGVWRDAKTHTIKPGRVVHAVPQFHAVSDQRLWEERQSVCFFEHVYFAFHRTRIDGKSVADVRFECGKILAEMDADGPDGIVVPVPESARISATGYADTRHLNRVDLLEKLAGSGRTFIEPAGQREAKARQKYRIKENLLAGDDIILLDDSIVRGTTMQVLVAELRSKMRGGKIHLRIASPPILSPCFYGIDFPTASELLARRYAERTPASGVLPDDVLAAIAADLGVDSLKFLPVTAIPRALGMNRDQICMACVTHEYPTAAGTRLALQQLTVRPS